MAKVLILEDSDFGKVYMEYLMSQLPEHEFVWQRDISSAKAEINQTYSVVVLDQVLENGELGTSFMTWCKEKYPHINGILFSGYTNMGNVIEALEKKMLLLSVPKGSDGLARLPKLIDMASTPVKIGKIRTWKALFSPITVYKMSEYVLNDNFLDEKLWETVQIMHAGQKTTNKMAREFIHNVSVKCDSSISTGISHKMLSEIVTRSMKMDMAYSNTAESSTKDYDERIDEYEMPAIESNPNSVWLSSVKIQINRIYEVRKVCLKVTCPICNGEQYIECEVYIPTKRDKARKIMVYSDQSKKILEI